MLKPKNISIKKLENLSKDQHNKNKNSNKSIKILKKNSHDKPSPIQTMKNIATLNDSSDVEHSDFITCINGYLHQFGQGTVDASKLNNPDLEQISRKIKKEKLINRSLQKNIINFQKILWERTEKLEILEQKMIQIQSKENIPRNLVNSQSKSRGRLSKKSSRVLDAYLNANSQFEYLQSEDSQEYDFERYKKRRRTEVPAEIQMLISKTMGVRPTQKPMGKYR